MIVSASRRTDIPAFYSEWLARRLRAGYVDVANPFNPRQHRRVDLRPESVDAIVFWTRNARPLLKYLPEIDRTGYRYYFLYTITGYPKELEENLPPLQSAVETFKRLSDTIGLDQVVWRYDPIIISSISGPDYHRRNFEKIAATLSGHTGRVIVSFLDMYRKVERRLRKISENHGVDFPNLESQQITDLSNDLKKIAESNDLDTQSCAENTDLSASEIRPGKCIDNDLMNLSFNLNLPYRKDPHQRKACLCTASADIGAYETCGYRCVYCYATSSFEKAAASLKAMDQNSESLYNMKRR
jgi:DNA repair photolyase